MDVYQRMCNFFWGVGVFCFLFLCSAVDLLVIVSVCFHSN